MAYENLDWTNEEKNRIDEYILFHSKYSDGDDYVISVKADDGTNHISIDSSEQHHFQIAGRLIRQGKLSVIKPDTYGFAFLDDTTIHITPEECEKFGYNYLEAFRERLLQRIRNRTEINSKG